MGCILKRLQSKELQIVLFLFFRHLLLAIARYIELKIIEFRNNYMELQITQM